MKTSKDCFAVKKVVSVVGWNGCLIYLQLNIQPSDRDRAAFVFGSAQLLL